MYLVIHLKKPDELIWMCHIEDESSWTINVKLSFVLFHLLIWHPTGRPKWETARKAYPQWAFIHLNFFPHVPGAFLPVIWHWNRFFGSGYQTKTTWSSLFCSIPVHSSPHSRSFGGMKVLRRPQEKQGCSWGSAWDPAKRHVLHCGTEKRSFKLIRVALEHKETWTTNS